MNSKEQFEKALEAEKIRQGRPWHNSYVAVSTDGIYLNGATRAMWWAWQASRQTLEILVPEEFGEDRLISKAERYARSETLSECICAIQAAGAVAKVKP